MSMKSSYITGKLHYIGNQIAGATMRRQTPHSNQEGQPPAQEAVTAPAPAAAPVAPTAAPTPAPAHALPKKHEAHAAALTARHEELLRLHRDVSARLSEQRAAISAELEKTASHSEALQAFDKKCEGLLASLDSLPEPQTDSPNYSKDLAAAMRSVEKARLELLMTQAKMEKSSGESAQAKEKRESILPEIDSLSFRQLFKFGLYLTLPIAGAIVIAGFIIAIAILASMRLGI